ncbi:hypothetical protein D9757_010076 [Collybiopsis confluens]|uniref:Cytochrome P450 n=1 Tax=Collybiopsis confluens TaxID=2823264 RepID=A0A8H5GZN2_9AGAR|nr:hypothetical protein D9757_010076 [Collybiopsis confluens]
MARRWSDILSGADDQTHIFNIPEWISRATLDVIGRAAFDYDFGATEDHETELGKAYQGMFLKVFGKPSKAVLITLELFRFIPPSVLEFLNEHNPNPRIAHVRHVAEIANGVAKRLVKNKSDEGRSDIMIKANAGDNVNAQLTEGEMLSMLRLLYELVRNPKLQSELRAEIRAAEKVAVSRGDSELSIRDLEGISLLSATVKASACGIAFVYRLWKPRWFYDIGNSSFPSGCLAYL